MNDVRVLLPIVAGGMVLLNTLLLLEFFPHGRWSPSRARGLLICYLLAASAGFWGTLLFDLWDPGGAGLGVAVVGMNLMATGPALLLALRGWKSASLPVPGSSWGWSIALTAALTGTETLMGAVFAGLELGPSRLWPSAPGGLYSALVEVLLSPWFLWGMVVAMVVLLCWVSLPAIERDVFLGLTATGVLGPLALTSPLAVALGMGTLMLVTIAIILGPIRSGESVAPEFVTVAWGALVAFALMTAAELASLVDVHAVIAQLPFALTMFVVMFGEMVYLVRRVLKVVGPATDRPSESGDRGAVDRWRLDA